MRLGLQSAAVGDRERSAVVVGLVVDLWLIAENVIVEACAACIAVVPPSICKLRMPMHFCPCIPPTSFCQPIGMHSVPPVAADSAHPPCCHAQLASGVVHGCFGGAATAGLALSPLAGTVVNVWEPFNIQTLPALTYRNPLWMLRERGHEPLCHLRGGHEPSCYIRDNLRLVVAHSQ